MVYSQDITSFREWVNKRECDLVHVESPSFSENSRKYCGDGRIVK